MISERLRALKAFNARDTWHTLASVDESVHKCLRRCGYFSEAMVFGPSRRQPLKRAGPRQQQMERFPGKYYAPC